MTDTSAQVAGEPVDALLAAFSSVLAQSTTVADGSMRVSALLTPDVGYPLGRALMRMEAELLLASADRLSEGDGEERTPAQRRWIAPRGTIP